MRMTISGHAHAIASPPPTHHAVHVERLDGLAAELIERLGFFPGESIVARWVSDGAEELVQRVNIDLTENCMEAESWISEFLEPSRQYQPDGVHLIVVSESSLDSIVLFLERVKVVIESEFVGTVDYSVISENGIWLSTCESHCSPHAKPIIDSVVSNVAPSRTEFFESCNYSPELGIARKIQQNALSDLAQSSDNWRSEAVKELLAAITAPVEPRSDRELARLASISTDVKIRDTLLWEIANSNVDPLHSARIFTSMLPHLRGTWAAPIATLAGLCWWVTGSGARANMCIDRALKEDPKYRLATLVRAALLAGLPPRFWIESVQELTRNECLYGVESTESG
jgi:hypothetical protein